MSYEQNNENKEINLNHDNQRRPSRRKSEVGHKSFEG